MRSGRVKMIEVLDQFGSDFNLLDPNATLIEFYSNLQGPLRENLKVFVCIFASLYLLKKYNIKQLFTLSDRRKPEIGILGHSTDELLVQSFCDE